MMLTPSKRQEARGKRQELYASKIVRDVQNTLHVSRESLRVEAARAHALVALKTYHSDPKFRRLGSFKHLTLEALKAVLREVDDPREAQGRDARVFESMLSLVRNDFEQYGCETAIANATNAQAAPSVKPTVRQREGFAERIVELVWGPGRIALHPELGQLFDTAMQPARRHLLLLEVHPEHLARVGSAWIERHSTGLVDDILRIVGTSLPPGPRDRARTAIEGVLRQYIELIQKLQVGDSLAVGERIHREVEASLKAAEPAPAAVAAGPVCPSCASTQIHWNPRASVYHCPLCSWSKPSLVAPPPPPRFAVGDWVNDGQLGTLQVMSACWNDSTWAYHLVREGRLNSLQHTTTAIGIHERALQPASPCAQQPAGGRIMPSSELHKLERQAAKMLRFGSNMLGGAWVHDSRIAPSIPYWPAVPLDPEKKPR